MFKIQSRKVYLILFSLLVVVLVGYPSYEHFSEFDQEGDKSINVEMSLQRCIDSASDCALFSANEISLCVERGNTNPACSDVVDRTYSSCLVSCQSCLMDIGVGSEGSNTCISLLSNNDAPIDWEISRKFKDNFQTSGIAESLLLVKPEPEATSPSPSAEPSNSCGCENDDCACKDTKTLCLDLAEFEKICGKLGSNVGGCARNNMGTTKDCTIFLTQPTCDLLGIDDSKELPNNCSELITKGLDDGGLGRKLEEVKMCCLIKHEETHAKDKRCIRDIPLVCAEDNTGYEAEIPCTQGVTSQLCDLYPTSKECVSSCFHQLSKIIQEQYMTCHCKAITGNNPNPTNTNSPAPTNTTRQMSAIIEDKTSVSEDCEQECKNHADVSGQLSKVCVEIFNEKYEGGLDKVISLGCSSIRNVFDPIYHPE